MKLVGLSYFRAGLGHPLLAWIVELGRGPAQEAADANLRPYMPAGLPGTTPAQLALESVVPDPRTRIR